MVKLGIATVSRSAPLPIATEYMYNAVLDFFCYGNKIHVVTATGRTLDLDVGGDEYNIDEA